MSLEPLDGEAIDGGRVRSLRRGFDSRVLREGVLHPRDGDQREAQIEFTSADIATVHKEKAGAAADRNVCVVGGSCRVAGPDESLLPEWKWQLRCSEGAEISRGRRGGRPRARDGP
jgi:hypothetical protein